MKLAKTIAVGALVIVGVCGTVRAEDKTRPAPDMAARIHGFLPQRAEDWNSAAGAELQARFWNDSKFGTALSIGMDSWQAKNEYTEDGDEQVTLTSSIYGNVTLLPVGASMLFRNEVSDGVVVILEAGVKYVFTDSNLNAEITQTDASGETYTKDKIYCDNPVLGVVGITVEAAMGEDFSVQCGVGYQFDLTHPRETFMGEDMGTTSFNSPIFRLGVSWAF